MAKEEEWEEFTRNLRGRLKAICSAKAMGLEVLPMGVVRGGGRRGRDVTV